MRHEWAIDFAVPRNYGFPNGAFYIFQQNSSAKSNYNSLQASLHVTISRVHVNPELCVVEVAGQLERWRGLS